MTLRELQEQKAALDLQIAQAVRQATIQKKALELKLEEQRKVESVQAILEIKTLIRQYQLSKYDIFEDLKPEPIAKSSVLKFNNKATAKSSLSDMRTSYNEIW